MEFSFDPAKSESNKTKHGIDFVEAQRLWDDPLLVTAVAKVDDEPRFLAVGRLGDRHWTAVCVWRDDSLRLISVRRAREKEIELYESR